MCVPIKQNPQDYAVHSIFEDTILMYHKFRKNQAYKKWFFQTRQTWPTYCKTWICQKKYLISNNLLFYHFFAENSLKNPGFVNILSPYKWNLKKQGFFQDDQNRIYFLQLQ